MGNRAVVINRKDMISVESRITQKGPNCFGVSLPELKINPEQIGVYLHWNGGRDSIEAFLKYCELQGYRAPSDDCYGWANLCKVIGNYFGDGLSLGIDVAKHLDCDNYDNGVYIIDGWKITGRMYRRNSEQCTYRLEDMLIDIDNAMPEKDQLGEDYLTAEEVPIEEIKIGDKVYPPCHSSKEAFEVLGYGQGVVNGRVVTGIPYVNVCAADDPAGNINNYLAVEGFGGFIPATVRRARSK